MSSSAFDLFNKINQNPNFNINHSNNIEPEKKSPLYEVIKAKSNKNIVANQGETHKQTQNEKGFNNDKVEENIKEVHLLMNQLEDYFSFKDEKNQFENSAKNDNNHHHNHDSTEYTYTLNSKYNKNSNIYNRMIEFSKRKEEKLEEQRRKKEELEVSELRNTPRINYNTNFNTSNEPFLIRMKNFQEGHMKNLNQIKEKLMKEEDEEMKRNEILQGKDKKLRKDEIDKFLKMIYKKDEIRIRKIEDLKRKYLNEEKEICTFKPQINYEKDRDFLRNDKEIYKTNGKKLKERKNYDDEKENMKNAFDTLEINVEMKNKILVKEKNEDLNRKNQIITCNDSMYIRKYKEIIEKINKNLFIDDEVISKSKKALNLILNSSQSKKDIQSKISISVKEFLNNIDSKLEMTEKESLEKPFFNYKKERKAIKSVNFNYDINELAEIDYESLD